jgi:1-acyl-sn-glycerol-3-phosphate acyltransferase
VRTDLQTIEQHILDLARELGREITPGEPIALDSLERAELVFALEERLGGRLTADLSFRTLPEAVEEIATSLEGQVRAPALAEGIGHLQWLAQALIRKAVSAYYRLDVTGIENVPRAGPAVLAMNHDSLLDIPLLVLASPRPVWFMAKAELFPGGFPSWFFHVLGAFPVRRGGFDLPAIRAALEALNRGLLLAMYPEGTRGPSLGPFLPGSAWLALATRAPLIPVAITGTADAMPRGSRVPRRTHVHIRFGEPLEPEREDQPRARLARAREMTAELRSAVQILLEPKERSSR